MLKLKQPLLGIVASVLIIALSLAFISLFSFPVLAGWLSFALQCLIPAQIMVGVLWKGDHPKFAARQRQPSKGIVLFVITLVCGVIIGAIFFTTIGGGISPPTPMLAHATILSVAVMFWLAIVWGGWPVNVFVRHPVAAGLVTLAASYLLTAVIFRVFFNYDFMQAEPRGLINAWRVLAVCVTTLAVMFLMLLFEVWPLTHLKNPLLGMVWMGIIMGLGVSLFEVGTGIFQMDPVAFLVSVPIPFIFGTIIVLNMLQNSLFDKLVQPMKGIANTAAAAILGAALAMLFSIFKGKLSSGPPMYESEIWLASALLSVTFPFLIFFAEFFKFWPLQRD